MDHRRRRSAHGGGERPEHRPVHRRRRRDRGRGGGRQRTLFVRPRQHVQRPGEVHGAQQHQHRPLLHRAPSHSRWRPDHDAARRDPPGRQQLQHRPREVRRRELPRHGHVRHDPELHVQHRPSVLRSVRRDPGKVRAQHLHHDLLEHQPGRGRLHHRGPEPARRPVPPPAGLRDRLRRHALVHRQLHRVVRRHRDAAGVRQVAHQSGSVHADAGRQ